MPGHQFLETYFWKLEWFPKDRFLLWHTCSLATVATTKVGLLPKCTQCPASKACGKEESIETHIFFFCFAFAFKMKIALLEIFIHHVLLTGNVGSVFFPPMAEDPLVRMERGVGGGGLGLAAEKGGLLFH